MNWYNEFDIDLILIYNNITKQNGFQVFHKDSKLCFCLFRAFVENFLMFYGLLFRETREVF